MAGASAHILDEQDDDDIDDLQPSLPQRPDADIPPGLSGGGLAPQKRQTQQNDDLEFEIIETDREGRQPTERPLSSDNAPHDPNTIQPPQDDRDNPSHRRPRTRAERNAARRAYEQRLEAQNRTLAEELEQIKARVGSFEPRLNEFDQTRRQDQIHALDQQIAEQTARARQAKQQMTQAITTGDAEAISAAMEAREEALRAADRLTVQKERLASAPAAEPVDPRQTSPQQFQNPRQPPPIAPAVAMRVEGFAADKPWYNPTDPNNLDSQIVLQIDRAVANEGFDPRTDDYWDEIESRAAQYLPHRFGRQQQQPQARQAQQPMRQIAPQAPAVAPQRRGPMVGGGSDRTPVDTGNKLYLSPERKQAMIQVGALDADGRTISNPTKFKRLAAQYVAFDRQNGTA